MEDIQAILFDVDGTLLDTNEFIFQAFEHTITTQGFTSQTREQIRNVIGKNLEDCYTLLTGCTHPADLVEAHRAFQENNYHLSTPFQNTIETLTKLKESGFKIAVITTRFKRTSIQTLANAKILEFFDLVLSGDDVKNLKPHPESLEKALEFFDIAPQQAAMVGDTHVDVLAGKNAGTKTIGVTYGFGGEKIKEHNPDFVVEDIADILKVLGIKNHI